MILATRRAQRGEQHAAMLGALGRELIAERLLDRYGAIEDLVDPLDHGVGAHLIRSISRGRISTISSLRVPSVRTPAMPPFLTSARAPVISWTT